MISKSAKIEISRDDLSVVVRSLLATDRDAATTTGLELKHLEDVAHEGAEPSAGLLSALDMEPSPDKPGVYRWSYQR